VFVLFQLDDVEVRIGELLKKIQAIELPKAYQPHRPDYHDAKPQMSATPIPPSPMLNDQYGGIPNPYGSYLNAPSASSQLYPSPVSQVCRHFVKEMNPHGDLWKI
jgi:hypothetical protein